MDQTVQNNTAQEKSRLRALEKRLYGLKVLPIPLDATRKQRLIKYNTTSLERSYFEIPRDTHDLLLNIDLVNKDKYKIDNNLQMDNTEDNADEKHLEKDVLAPQDSKRSRHHPRSVSWLGARCTAAKESAKEIATKNKADSNDNDDNESRKGDFKKNNLGSDSDASNDNEEPLATSIAKRANSETVDSERPQNHLKVVTAKRNMK